MAKFVKLNDEISVNVEHVVAVILEEDDDVLHVSTVNGNTLTVRNFEGLEQDLRKIKGAIEEGAVTWVPPAATTRQ